MAQSCSFFHYLSLNAKLCLLFILFGPGCDEDALEGKLITFSYNCNDRRRISDTHKSRSTTSLRGEHWGRGSLSVDLREEERAGLTHSLTTTWVSTASETSLEKSSLRGGVGLVHDSELQNTDLCARSVEDQLQSSLRPELLQQHLHSSRLQSAN